MNHRRRFPIIARTYLTILLLILQQVSPVIALTQGTDNTEINDVAPTAIQSTPIATPTPTPVVTSTPVVTPEVSEKTDNVVNTTPIVRKQVTVEDLTIKTPVVTNVKLQKFTDLVIGKEYVYTQNSDVVVTFTKLPTTTGNELTIEEVTVSVDGKSLTGFDIKSNMVDGEFTYDLKLPNTIGTNAEVKYSEDGTNFVDATNETITSDSAKLSADHFTVFVIVPVDPNTTVDCSGYVAWVISRCDRTPYVFSNTNVTVLSKIIGPSSWTFRTEDYVNPGPASTKAVANFLNAPDTTPLGAGSAHLKAGQTKTKAVLGTTQFAGTKLGDISALSYKTYVVARPNTGLNTIIPYLTIYVDVNGDGQFNLLLNDDILTYSNTQNVPTGSWYNIDAYNGRWVSTTSRLGTTSSTGSAFADIKMSHPSARIINPPASVVTLTSSPTGGFRFNVGDSGSVASWNGLEAYIDALNFNGDTFDFERTPNTPPTIDNFSIARNGGWNDGLILNQKAHYYIDSANTLPLNIDGTYTYPVIGGNVTLGADFQDVDNNLVTTRVGVHSAWFNQPSNWAGIPLGNYNFAWDTTTVGRHNYTTGATDTLDGVRKVMLQAQDGENLKIFSEVNKEYYAIIDNTDPTLSYGPATPVAGRKFGPTQGTISINANFADNYGLYDITIGVSGQAASCTFGPSNSDTNDTPTNGLYPCNVNISTLTNGTYYYSIQARDKAGNVTTLATRSFIIDSTPPVTPNFTTPANNSFTQVNGTLLIWTGGNDVGPNASGTAGYVMRYVLEPADGSATTTWNSGLVNGNLGFRLISFGGKEGRYTFYIKTIDNVGNESAESTPLVITYDNTNPAAFALATIPDNSYTNMSGGAAKPLILTWNQTTDFSFDHYEFQFAPQAYGCNRLVYPYSNSSFTSVSSTTFTNNSSVNADGRYCWRVYAVDKAGNRTQATTGNGKSYWTLTIDTHAPILTLPGNIVKEAVSASGNTVTFAASANDNFAGSVPVSCTTDSGSTFPLGTTTVNCSASDLAGNIGTGSFTVKIQDTIAPVVTVPSTITADAASATGSNVTFTPTPTALDNIDGVLLVTCVPVSNSLFALGTTTVNCSATDNSGNKGSASFSIQVKDLSAPRITVPADKTVEATGPSGATVPYTVTATDNVDGQVGVTCTLSEETLILTSTKLTLQVLVPTSVPSITTNFSSQFPLGVTEVTCTSKDAAGNESSKSFFVEVVDTTKPTINTPADMTVEATSPAGATATYTITSSDIVDGNVSSLVACAPTSGSLFGLGENTVNCTVTDNAANTATGSFKINVVDTTPPTVSGKTTFSGWYNSDQVSTFTFTDTVSPIVSGTPVTCTISTEGLNQTCSVTVNVCDSRGNCNTSTITSNGANVDKTIPTAGVTFTPGTATESANVTARFTANDNVGLFSICYRVNNGGYYCNNNVTFPYFATQGLQNLGAGTYTVRYYVIDQSGLRSDSNAGTAGSQDYATTYTVNAIPVDAPTATPTITPTVAPTGAVEGLSTEQILGLIDQKCEAKNPTSGYVYVDKNGNGKKDSDESGAANVEVILFLQNVKQDDGSFKDVDIIKVKTDSAGKWSATVCAGSYKVRVNGDTLPANTSAVKGVSDLTVKAEVTGTSTDIALSEKAAETASAFNWWILVIIAIGLGAFLYFYRRNKGEKLTF